jgi:hypothetical protein
MGDAEEGLEDLEGLDLEDFVLSEKACIKSVTDYGHLQH